ncbi:MAG: hypothetical protein CSB44_01740 [Gammaproteobacteria bacterium]|nr:MAG: hypothetical protein CSB44_01740 [Gammaproteobacteria bacterium]
MVNGGSNENDKVFAVTASRTKRGWRISFILLAIVSVVLLVLLVDVRDIFPEYSKTRSTFMSAGNELHGTLVLPRERQGPFPVVMFVHGDGPLEHDAFGYYEAMWGALAARGIASFAWDKPGAGESEGNWLEQDMQARADEVDAAYRHLNSLENVASDKVGLIGFSQAGWVLPRLAGNSWVRYMVFVSTAINWIEQGDYMHRRRLASKNAAKSVVEAELALDRFFNQLLSSDDTDYADYVREIERVNAQGERLGQMSRDRFEFVRLNIREDARRHLADIRVPVLALFGEDDLNVDVNDSIEHYRRVFDGNPQVDFTYRVFPDATHQLSKTRYFNDQSPGLLAVLLINVLGDDVFAAGVLDDIGNFVEKHSLPDTDEVRADHD